MKRKAIILALCASMALSVPMGVSATSVTDFTDVPADSWYYDDVKGAVDHGYMNGTSGSTFDPSNQMTRAMATTVFARFDEAVVDDSKPTIFTDVPVNQWYTGSIAWANEQKLVEGVGDNRFSPNNFISRQDMAVIMDRYIKNKGYSLKESPLIDSFKDASSISDYAREAVENCRKYGLINGYDDGTFGPKTDINRAQAAAMFERMKVVVDNNQITPPKKPTGGSSGVPGSSNDYMDYTVKLVAGRFDAYSIDKTDGDTVYHINPNSSNNNDFYAAIKNVFTEDKITHQILDKATAERTKVHVSDNVGDQSLITEENGDKYLNAEFVIKYVTMQDVFGNANDTGSIASKVCTQVAEALTKKSISASDSDITRGVNTVIGLLDMNVKDELTDPVEKEAAIQLHEKLDNLIKGTGDDKSLWQTVQDQAGMDEETLKKLGITESNIKSQANEYLDVLASMAGRTSTVSAANVSMYAGDSSTQENGIAVTINIGLIIGNVYDEQKAKIIENGDLWNDPEIKNKVTYGQIGAEVMELYNACNPVTHTPDDEDKAVGSNFVGQEPNGNEDDGTPKYKYKIKGANDVEKGIAGIIDAINGLHNKLVQLHLSSEDLQKVLNKCCNQFGIVTLGVPDVIFEHENPKLTDITREPTKTLDITVQLDRGFFKDEIIKQLDAATDDNGEVSEADIKEIVDNIVNKIPEKAKTAHIVITAKSCEETNTH